MNRHVWKFKWKVTEGDLQVIEQWVEEQARKVALGDNAPGVMGDSKLVANAGLTVSQEAGAFLSAEGEIIVFPAPVNIDFSVDESAVPTNPSPGNERWVIAVLEYAVQSTNSQTDPVTLLPFDFHQLASYTIRVIAGSEAPPPTAAVPSFSGNGIILGGVRLQNGQATILNSELRDGDDELVAGGYSKRGALAHIYQRNLNQRFSGEFPGSGSLTVQEALEKLGTLLLRRSGDTMNGNLDMALGAGLWGFDGQPSPVPYEGFQIEDPGTPGSDPRTLFGSAGAKNVQNATAGLYARDALGDWPVAWTRTARETLTGTTTEWIRIAEVSSANGTGAALFSLSIPAASGAGRHYLLFMVSKDNGYNGAITLLHATQSNARFLKLRLVYDEGVDTGRAFIDVQMVLAAAGYDLSLGLHTDSVDQDYQPVAPFITAPVLTGPGPGEAHVLELDLTDQPSFAVIQGAMPLQSASQPARAFGVLPAIDAVETNAGPFAVSNPGGGIAFGDVLESTATLQPGLYEIYALVVADFSSFVTLIDEHILQLILQLSSGGVPIDRRMCTNLNNLLEDTTLVIHGQVLITVATKFKLLWRLSSQTPNAGSLNLINLNFRYRRLNN